MAIFFVWGGKNFESFIYIRGTKKLFKQLLFQIHFNIQEINLGYFPI